MYITLKDLEFYAFCNNDKTVKKSFIEEEMKSFVKLTAE